MLPCRGGDVLAHASPKRPGRLCPHRQNETCPYKKLMRHARDTTVRLIAWWRPDPAMGG